MSDHSNIQYNNQVLHSEQSEGLEQPSNLHYRQNANNI